MPAGALTSTAPWWPRVSCSEPRASAVFPPTQSKLRQSPFKGLPLQYLPQFSKRSCVDHIIRGQPAAPRLIDPEPHILERIHGMCVGRNRDFGTFALRRMGMDVVQIEPIRLRIDLQVASQ